MANMANNHFVIRFDGQYSPVVSCGQMYKKCMSGETPIDQFGLCRISANQSDCSMDRI